MDSSAVNATSAMMQTVTNAMASPISAKPANPTMGLSAADATSATIPTATNAMVLPRSAKVACLDTGKSIQGATSARTAIVVPAMEALAYAKFVKTGIRWLVADASSKARFRPKKQLNDHQTHRLLTTAFQY